MSTSRPTSQSSTPAPGASPQTHSTATPPQVADPFASLMSASPRPGTGPFQAPAPQTQPAPASSSLLDLAGGSATPPQAAGKPAAEDDEWNFASSLPPSNALPMMNKVQVLNSQLRIDFAARRVQNSPRQIYIQAVFSNATSQPIGELHFQVAVEKVESSPLRTLSGWKDHTNHISRIHSNSDRSQAETSHRSSRTVCSRRWSWTESTRAKVTRSKSGSKSPTSWEPRPAKSRGWCRP